MKVFLDCDEYEEPSWASSDSSSSWWDFEVGSTPGPPASEVIIAFEYPSSDGLLDSKLPASGPLAPDVSSNTEIFVKF